MAKSKKQNNTNNHEEESPLRLFGEAKEQINQLFAKLDDSVSKASDFYSSSELDVSENDDYDRLKQLDGSIKTIKGVLVRDRMKVAFFGRTSNGKSTVINAILKNQILPMGWGHTTSCFLHIEGNNEEEAFLENPENGLGKERQPIQSLDQIANALNSDSKEYSTLVKIYWPVSQCPLLKFDVVLMDSPGVDQKVDLDNYIDQYCLDADVFVFVANAMTSLSVAEEKFFHKVSEKLSKPNIFMLTNFSDALDNRPDSVEKVKQQHIEASIKFLSQELKICTPDEVRQRTFFISAWETLESRCPSGQNNNIQRSRRSVERGVDFVKFERLFEDCLSKSAVKTKFMNHTDKAKETINELKDILMRTKSLTEKQYIVKLQELEKAKKLYSSIDSSFYVNERELVEQIHQIRRQVQRAADTEIDNEIRRISRAVEEFDGNFSTNSDSIRIYKNKLYAHVEESLNDNLKSRINSVIAKYVNPFNQVMCDISLLLSDKRQQKIREAVASQNYTNDTIIDLKLYKKFYTGFQEDLEFRFSLGLVSIIRKFQSRFSPTKSISMNESFDESKLSNSSDISSVLMRLIINPPQSQTTVLSLAIGGILVRSVGTTVILVTTVIYGSLYAYEYLTWTNAAKEKALKSQYVKYAKKGLQDCLPMISQNIAISIEEKLTMTFGKVKKEIDVESGEIKEKISLLKQSLDKLRICDEFTRNLLGDSDILLTEFAAFATSFLN